MYGEEATNSHPLLFAIKNVENFNFGRPAYLGRALPLELTVEGGEIL